MYITHNGAPVKESASLLTVRHAHVSESTALYRAKICDRYRPWVAKQQCGGGAVNVPNEYIFDTAEVRVFELLEHSDVVELDIEVLVDRFEGSSDRDVVLELNGYS